MHGDIKSSILRIIILLIGTIIFGTLAYHVIEGWPLFDCLYMTVITITTTGYKEVGEMGVYGKILSMFLMFFGVGIFMYTINVLVPVLVERRIRRWEKMLEKIKDHYIICGFGLMGREVAKELDKDRVVIIDSDINKVNSARERGYIAIHGDATDETILEKAGVKRAKVIIGCMTDVCNAFALLAAKDLNPNIYTIAVLRNPDAETKLRRVGVDFILSPYRDVAKKVFAMLMRPATIEFIETIMGRRGDSFMLEKIVLEKGELIGKTLKEIDLRKRVGCMVVAIARNGELLLPDPNIKLEKGDVLFVIGKEESLRKLDELI